MKHSPFDATILAFDVETSALATRHSAWRHQCRVSGDCGVGITPSMYNRATNHGDMGTFSKPDGLHMCVIFMKYMWETVNNCEKHKKIEPKFPKFYFS